MTHVLNYAKLQYPTLTVYLEEYCANNNNIYPYIYSFIFISSIYLSIHQLLVFATSTLDYRRSCIYIVSALILYLSIYLG